MLPDSVTRPEQFKEKLLIKGKEQTYLIHIRDILLVERVDGSTDIVTRDDTYKTSVSLAEMEEKLDKKLFMRCHKSYIVNLTQITRIEPYGRWTYVVKFKDSSNTALMTAQNYEEMKKRFS